MARVHYRTGRIEEHEIPDGWEVWSMTKIEELPPFGRFLPDNPLGNAVMTRIEFKGIEFWADAGSRVVVEYFETRPWLGSCQRTRLKERRRLLSEQIDSFKGWIRRVKLMRLVFGVSWKVAKSLAGQNQVERLGAWSSRWPRQVNA